MKINRRDVLIGTTTVAAAAVVPAVAQEATVDAYSLSGVKSRVPPKLQRVLDQLSKTPSTLSPELEAYLQRTEGWIDRLGGDK